MFAMWKSIGNLKIGITFFINLPKLYQKCHLPKFSSISIVISYVLISVSHNVEPEMADLNKIVVVKVMIQWEKLADGFRYDDQVIANIKLQNRENPEECCRAFLRNWLITNNGERTGPKTWSTLFDIIKEYMSIGSDIREEMITQVKKLK